MMCPVPTRATINAIAEGSGSVWTQQAKLTASDGTKGDTFGHSGAISGDSAVIGTFGGGSAYAFVAESDVFLDDIGELTGAGEGFPDYFFHPSSDHGPNLQAQLANQIAGMVDGSVEVR